MLGIKSAGSVLENENAPSTPSTNRAAKFEKPKQSQDKVSVTKLKHIFNNFYLFLRNSDLPFKVDDLNTMLDPVVN